MPKPDKYPLPWCERLDMPYHAANMKLIMTRKGWAEFQANKSMSELIPLIDKIIGGEDV